MNYRTKFLKCHTTKIIVAPITVGKFELANLVCKCSAFVLSLLGLSWSPTAAVLQRAGANAKPHDYKRKKNRNEVLSENMASTGNLIENFG